MTGWSERWRDDDGTAVLLLAPALVAVAMLAVAVVDVAAYLVAASRAQAAADAAALAAVTARDHPMGAGEPAARAGRVADEADGRLERCDCHTRGRPVEVEVSVEVHAAVITRFAGSRVHAVARAELSPAEPRDPAVPSGVP